VGVCALVTRVHVCVNESAHGYVHVGVCACICVSVCTCMCVCMWVYICGERATGFYTSEKKSVCVYHTNLKFAILFIFYYYYYLMNLHSYNMQLGFKSCTKPSTVTNYLQISNV